MSDLSDIRRSHFLKRQSNEMILFLATKDFLSLCGAAAAAAVEERPPSGGVRFLKIKNKIGFRDVFPIVQNQLVSWIVLYKRN